MRIVNFIYFFSIFLFVFFFFFCCVCVSSFFFFSSCMPSRSSFKRQDNRIGLNSSRVQNVIPPLTLFLNSSDPEVLVQLKLESTRGFVNLSGGRGTRNRPLPRFETGRSIQQEGQEEEEEEGTNSISSKGFCQGKKMSFMFKKKTKKSILHSDEIMSPGCPKSFFPGEGGYMNKRDSDNSVSNTRKQQPLFCNQHRYALMYDMNALEMEQRMEIWKEFIQELYILFMEQELIRWSLWKASVYNTGAMFNEARNIIASFFNCLVEIDLDTSYTEYNSIGVESTSLSPRKYWWPGWYRVVRPWRKQQHVSQKGTDAVVSTSISNIGSCLKNNASGRSSTPRSVIGGELERVNAALRVHFIEYVILNLRYKLWEEVLLSSRSIMKDNMDELEYRQNSSFSLASSQSKGIHSRWEVFLGGLRSGACSKVPKAFDLSVSLYFDLISDVSASSQRSRTYGHTTGGQYKYKRLGLNSFVHNVHQSVATNFAGTGGTSTQVYSEDDNTVSVGSDILDVDTGPGEDASLLYRSFCGANDWILNTPLSFLSVTDPMNVTSPAVHTKDHFKLNDSSLLESTVSPVTRPSFITHLGKHLALPLSLEHLERHEIMNYEALEFKQILRSTEREWTWSMETFMPNISIERGMSQLQWRRIRSMLLQMVEEKSIIFMRYKNEMRLMGLYLDFLGVVSTLERSAMNFFHFFRFGLENCSSVTSLL
ncbi:hypothetical protein MOQ_001307 [Trypanosoma cruzi marinkellei]|uniref:Uncharacterized protein n=1 Tax=Trypanosoma cruzi marinkellei TaxID=85056 RepID=K2PBL0_TRYCR|nr:hypothetical protein MOQ_001307 [Trypanosoma cruzi marinkellei]